MMMLKKLIGKIFKSIKKFIHISFTYGPIHACKIVIAKLKRKSDNTSLLYQELIIDRKEELHQKNYKFDNKPFISILVPLYNTSEKFFEEMIYSVLYQTYGNWELILTDASNDDGVFRESLIKKINDSRIKYKKMIDNLGIVGNTNQAFKYVSGDYIGLLDHDDVLAKNCLFEVVKAINEDGADFIYTDEITFKKKLLQGYQPNLKPDFSPDTLRSYNFICHFSCFSKHLLSSDEELLNPICEGSQDYDLILRLTERAKCIKHVDKVLYFWRAHEQSTAQSALAKPYTMDAAKVALINHLKRKGYEGVVKDGNIATTYRIEYKIKNDPMVSIVIPNKDHIEDLKKCLRSIFEKSTYQNYEIIIIENNSTDNETFLFYDYLNSTYKNIKILYFKGSFNYSAINNFGIKGAQGEYILFLNNDIEIITPNWMEEMLMYAQRDDIGCVGCRLLYPDDSVQHAGVIIGIGSVAGHAHKYFKKDDFGFMSRLQIVQNLSAVTAACLLVKKLDYLAVGGFDEKFQIAFNDVDFCLRILELGKRNLYTPFAEAYHHESKSRGAEDNPQKVARFQSEIKCFEERWGLYRKDAYYHRLLSLEKEDFSLKI